MASLIAGNSTDSIQTVINNNSLLASRNSSANNKLNSDAHSAQKVGSQSNSNVSHSTQVNLTHSQSTSSSLGLYNKYGSLPATVPSASNADGKNNMKSAHAASSSGGASSVAKGANKANAAANKASNTPGTQEANYLARFLKTKL